MADRKFSPTHEVFLALNEYLDDSRTEQDFSAVIAYNTAIDLWDGMTKGLGGQELIDAASRFCDAMESNAQRSPEEASSYRNAAEVAQIVFS